MTDRADWHRDRWSEAISSVILADRWPTRTHVIPGHRPTRRAESLARWTRIAREDRQADIIGANGAR